MTLLVEDAETGEPLKDIAVTYLVTRATYRTSWLWVLPPIESFIGESIEIKRSAMTDINGEVHFGDLDVRLREYLRIRERVDRIKTEEVFINIRPSEDAKKFLLVEGETNDEFDFLHRDCETLGYMTRPNKTFKGYVLTSADIPSAHHREIHIASYDFRPINLKQERAVFTIRLQRFR